MTCSPSGELVSGFKIERCDVPILFGQFLFRMRQKQNGEYFRIDGRGKNLTKPFGKILIQKLFQLILL